MYKTKPLSSLKSIFPPIHQPLPLNKRESQQLLGALTSSFRKHLDKEHGWLSDEPSTSPATSPTVHYYASSPPTSTRETHQRPTDQHLRAILSNPLFTYESKGNGPAALAGARRDPMDVFDEAVAKGMMTLKGAFGCLIATRRAILQSSTASMKNGMRESSAAFRILQWLRSSGLERDLSFMSHPRFVKFLLPFMVAEGLDELAWTWLARLTDGEGPAVVNKQTAASFLLENLVYTKSIEAKDLDEAYASMLRGVEIQGGKQHFQSNLLPPWRSLNWLSTVEAWKYSNPSRELFESYVAISEHFGRPKNIARAHLDLHHPTKPDPSLAVNFLLQQPFWDRIVASTTTPTSAHGTKPQPSNYHIRIMSFGLDTVQHLTQRGKPEEAQWILKLLRTSLGPYFGESHPSRDEPLLLG